MTFPNKTVYLAGPITGLTYKDARFGWREEFADMMTKMGFDHIHCRSPMRGKDFLKEITEVLSCAAEQYPDNPMGTEAGITTRDFNDVKTSDAMVACFLESNNVPSLGTASEYGYAHTLQTPIITVGNFTKDEHGKIITSDPNIKHVMLARMSGFLVPTLEEAALILGYLLTPGV